MKAILEFNLPEDQPDFQYAVDGWKWSMLVWDLDQKLRSETKHSDGTMHEERYKALYDVRDMIHEMMAEKGLKFE
jgi:hypothetical protein